MVLEVAVGDGSETIVRARQRFAHRVLRARIVEAREQNERAIADVAVGVFRHRLQQRRHRLYGGGAPHGPRSVGARRVVEIAQFVDRGLELSGGNGLRGAGFLASCRRRRRMNAEDAEDAKGQTEMVTSLRPWRPLDWASAAHLLLRDRLFIFGDRLFVELQGELQVARLVSRKFYGIASGVAGGAIRSPVLVDGAQ